MYRFGFNGKENDNEIKGTGNQQDYGARIYDGRLCRFLSLDPITREYPDLTPFQFASNSPINSIDLDGLEKDEIIDAISKGASWTGKLLKETASGIVASALHPIDAGVAIFHSTKKTVSQVGYFGGVFVQGVGYAFGGKQIEVNQEEFDKTAQDLSKSMVKTGVLAVVTTGIGEAYKAAPKIPIKTALNEAASTLPISEPVRGGARRAAQFAQGWAGDRKSTRLNSSHRNTSRMPSSA